MKKDQLLRVAGVLLTAALLGSLFFLRAIQNYNTQNYRNSNFFVFWLSGRLIASGESPYDANDWRAGHELHGSTELREPIFLYPLPLAVFLVPLGLFPVDQAYIGWQVVSQALIALAVFRLLDHWSTPGHRRLLIPIMLFLSYFGPIYLSLQIGSIGPATLLLLVAALILSRKNYPLAAGLLLSLTMLKPPQGLTILLLMGIWFLARRDWRAISGIVLGGVLLWLTGAIIDLDWVGKFLHSSEAAFDRRLGFQSNVWSFAHLACNKSPPCTFALGGAGALILLGLGGLHLWRKQARLSAWDAMNIILPVGFVSTVYLWAYDQILYVIPITWIVGTLVQKTKSYLHAFLFLLILVPFSFLALAQHAMTLRDLWSLGNTVIVLAGILFAARIRQKSPAQAGA